MPLLQLYINEPDCAVLKAVENHYIRKVVISLT